MIVGGLRYASVLSHCYICHINKKGAKAYFKPEEEVPFPKKTHTEFARLSRMVPETASFRNKNNGKRLGIKRTTGKAYVDSMFV